MKPLHHIPLRKRAYCLLRKTEEEVMLWQDTWTSIVERYKEISRLLDTYTAQPSLTVKINEMVNRFHAVIGDQFERAAASTELAERV